MRTKRQIERRRKAMMSRHTRRQFRQADADARDVVLREREQIARLNARGRRPSALERELAVLRREVAALRAAVGH